MSQQLQYSYSLCHYHHYHNEYYRYHYHVFGTSRRGVHLERFLQRNLSLRFFVFLFGWTGTGVGKSVHAGLIPPTPWRFFCFVYSEGFFGILLLEDRIFPQLCMKLMKYMGGITHQPVSHSVRDERIKRKRLFYPCLYLLVSEQTVLEIG